MELADQQVTENEGLTGAEIPVSTNADAGAPAPSASPTDKSSRSEKPLSLRDQINKSVETVRTEEAKRSRDATTGKFVAGAVEVSQERTGKPATEKAEIPKPEANAQPEGSKPVGPPSAWKAIWESLSPEAQALAVKREADVEKGFTEYRTKTAQLQEISQALDPVRQVFQQHGVQSDAQAVKKLIEWEGAFRNPATRMQAFQMLAQQYGVDFSTLVPSSQSAAPSPAQDIPDQLRPVIDQFGNIVQQVNQVSTRVQNWEQSQVADKLMAFAADPKHPHFEAVRMDMGRLMEAGFVSPGDLEGAYQKAVSLNPEISAKIRADEEQKRADELKRANAEKVRQASAAAVSPSTRPPLGTAPPQSGSKKSSVRESVLNAVNSLREEQRA